MKRSESKSLGEYGVIFSNKNLMYKEENEIRILKFWKIFNQSNDYCK